MIDSAIGEREPPAPTGDGGRLAGHRLREPRHGVAPPVAGNTAGNTTSARTEQSGLAGGDIRDGGWAGVAPDEVLAQAGTPTDFRARTRHRRTRRAGGGSPVRHGHDDVAGSAGTLRRNDHQQRQVLTSEPDDVRGRNAPRRCPLRTSVPTRPGLHRRRSRAQQVDSRATEMCRTLTQSTRTPRLDRRCPWCDLCHRASVGNADTPPAQHGECGEKPQQLWWRVRAARTPTLAAPVGSLPRPLRPRGSTRTTPTRPARRPGDPA
jgi:hypothetical protein